MFTWNKLIDRCRLFEPGARRPLLKTLLKEGEEEMCKALSLFERKMWLKGPFKTFKTLTDTFGTITTVEVVNDWMLLPQDFLSMKWVYVNGVQIGAIQQNQKVLDASNTKSVGSPTAYYVHNDRLYFDTIPDDDNILIEYFAQLTSTTKDKDFLIRDSSTLEIDGDDDENEDPPANNDSGNMQSAMVMNKKMKNYNIVASDQRDNQFEVIGGADRRDLYFGFAMDCDLGEALQGAKVSYNGEIGEIKAVGSITDSIGQFYYYDGGEVEVGRVITVSNYRDIGPIVPPQYQKELCYYALNLATGKEEYLKYWLGMLQGVEALDMDRDLIHTVKGVI